MLLLGLRVSDLGLSVAVASSTLLSLVAAEFLSCGQAHCPSAFLSREIMIHPWHLGKSILRQVHCCSWPHLASSGESNFPVLAHSRIDDAHGNLMSLIGRGEQDCTSLISESEAGE